MSNSANDLPVPGTTDSYFFSDTFDFPQINKTDRGFLPIGVFRGQENWLRRLNSAEPDTLIQETKALIARWLKMQNVCVLGGAGMSYYVGGFVGSGLLTRIQELLKGTAAGKTLEKALAFASDPSAVSKEFESLLSQLSGLVAFGSELSPLDKLPVMELFAKAGFDTDELTLLIRYMEASIAIICDMTLPASPLTLSDAELNAHEVFVAKLVGRDPQQGRARVFTTNYDTLLEQAMDRLGVIYCDGFSGTVERRFNPASYDIDFHYPGETTEGRVRRYDKVLQLYKLHGSVTWTRSAPTFSEPFGVGFRQPRFPSFDSLTKATLEERTKTLDAAFPENSGLAILPTASKYGQTLAMPYAHLFRSFSHALRQPQTVLFVIGYSGWDSHINQLIEDALSNPGFTCVLIDPVPSRWARRVLAADYSGRVYCFGGEWGRFEVFTSQLMPDLDVLETDLQIAKTLRNLQNRDANV